jgi:UDP-glucose 4-epimerase
METDPRTVVVTGAAGGIGQLVVTTLADHGCVVHGVDRNHPSFRPPEGVTFHQADIRKRGFHEVLRKHHPGAVVHLARERSFRVKAAERHRVNFEGTARVIDLAVQSGVRKVIFASRHTVYGALPDQAQFLTEEHPPMAGRTFPEVQDLVAADLYACGMGWRYPETEVVVLRPVNAVGPTVNTLLSRYLGRPRIFTIAGFDPLYQILHEQDLARAVEHALAPGLRGVFNVTGPGQVPLHVLIEHTGTPHVALPEPLLRLLMGRLGFPEIPRGAYDFLKYACTVDGGRFTEATGFSPAHGLPATLASLRRG